MTQTGEMSVPATKVPVPEVVVADEEAPRPELLPDVEDPVELVIEPVKGWIPVDWSELVRNRELLFFLVWRDIKVRYKQAVLGIGWAVLQPVMQMIVFTLIFGVAARFKTNLPIPYALLVLSGLLPWQLFMTSMTSGG